MAAVEREVARTGEIAPDGIMAVRNRMNVTERRPVTSPLYAKDPDQPLSPIGPDTTRSPGHDGGQPVASSTPAESSMPAASPPPAAATVAADQAESARLHATDTAARPASPAPWQAPAAQHSNAPAGRGGFLRLLAGGLRAILLLPVRPGSVSPGAGSCLVLVAIITAIGIVGEWWLLADPASRFNWSALRSAWFDLPVIVLGGAWLAQPRGPRWFRRKPAPAVTNRPPHLLHFAAVLLSASAWIVTLAYGVLIAMTEGVITGYPAIGTWIYLAAPLWSYVIAVRTLATMNRWSPTPLLRRFVILFLLAVTTAWSLIDPLESYWEGPDAPEPTNYAATAAASIVLARIR